MNQPEISISVGNRPISEIFECFITKVSEKYKLDMNSLTDLMKETLSDVSVSINFKRKVSEAEQCNYTIQASGKRCRNKISKDSTKFCSRHKKYDDIVEKAESKEKEVETKEEKKPKLKKRKVNVDKTGTLVDSVQGNIVYYYEESSQTYWAVGKKKVDGFRVSFLDEYDKNRLSKIYNSFKDADKSPFFKVLDEENINWINMIVESQRKEETIEDLDEWKDWILNEYLRMRDHCISGMEDKQFFDSCEIKLPKFIPSDYEIEQIINPDEVEILHRKNVDNDKNDLGDKIVSEFIECMLTNGADSKESRKYRYKSGLAYVFYEYLSKGEKEKYIERIRNVSDDYVNILYEIIGKDF